MVKKGDGLCSPCLFTTCMLRIVYAGLTQCLTLVLHLLRASKMSGVLPSIGYNTLLLDGEYTRAGQPQWRQRIHTDIGK